MHSAIQPDRSEKPASKPDLGPAQTGIDALSCRKMPARADAIAENRRADEKQGWVISPS